MMTDFILVTLFFCLALATFSIYKSIMHDRVFQQVEDILNELGYAVHLQTDIARKHQDHIVDLQKAHQHLTQSGTKDKN